ncbi:MAG: HupE/UreJ family protein [Burkholderiales bacterium]|nr:HupE/UreJ family protein [Burkholderiales bacterium]
MRRGERRALACASTLVAALTPQLAHAHLVSTGLGPVYDGILHFALTPEFVLPVLAIAMLTGLRGRAHVRLALVALPLAWLAAGIVADATAIAVPDALAWLPLLVAGGLVTLDLRLSPRATTVIATLLGIALGSSNGAALAQAGAGVRGVLGSTAAVFVIVTLGAATVTAWQTGWLRIAWRAAGSWIAAGGLLLLGWTLR